jgi:hypothetical protein
MSENEKQDENLTPFEAALAGLQPQPDRLDPRWRVLLAQEVLQKAQAGDCPNFCVNINGTVPFAAVQPREMTPCSTASDHVFACVYCGVRGLRMEPPHRWAWPAAFSAMTAVAALLLVMLVAQPGPEIASLDDKGTGPGKGIAAAALPDYSFDSPTDQLCYLGVRRQVLQHGVESWQLPASTQPPPSRTKAAPLLYREQLHRFLNPSDSENL